MTIQCRINCQSTTTQLGFAELKKTADDRANIGVTVIGAPIVSQQLAQYILTDHQDADCRPMIRRILSRQSLVCCIGPMFGLLSIHQSTVHKS